MQNRKYYIEDYITGIKKEVSKEEYDRIEKDCIHTAKITGAKTYIKITNMDFDIDLEIEEAKQRFTQWLDQRVAQELNMMNALYYFNSLGLMFTDSKDYIPMGKPVIFGTGGDLDNNKCFYNMWNNPTEFETKTIDFEDGERVNYFMPKYIMGVDPID